jgi:hypothetical protein
MADDKDSKDGKAPGGFLGSLRDALAAAGRDDPAKLPMRQPAAVPAAPAAGATPPPLPAAPPAFPKVASDQQRDAVAQPEMRPPPLPSAADAARAARGGTPHIPALERALERHMDADAAPVTQVIRGLPKAAVADDAARTQLVRGKPQVQRGTFATDPVVGWLVIVGGPGLGAFRPIFEGNNTLGRNSTQRVPIDFGDDAISSEEQAYIRYDSGERSFLFVPNLAKTNVVQLNSKRPTAAVPLNAMDVIVMGRTQLVFVPFCGPDFDWSELADIKG